MPTGQGEGSKATQFGVGNRANAANPGGRPKGFATKIKELCGDDYEQIAKGLFLIATAKSNSPEVTEFFGEDIKITTKDRIAAFIALRDSGPGRPAQTLEHRGDAPGMTRVIHEEAEIEEDDAA